MTDLLHQVAVQPGQVPPRELIGHEEHLAGLGHA
jgi:hypothetical protein